MSSRRYLKDMHRKNYKIKGRDGEKTTIICSNDSHDVLSVKRSPPKEESLSLLRLLKLVREVVVGIWE